MQKTKNPKLIHILRKIEPCIFGYIIKRSYLKLNRNRITSNTSIKLKSKFDNDDGLIELRQIGFGSSFNVFLYYSLMYDELIAIKKLKEEYDYDYLVDRVDENLSSICHPFMTEYFGKVHNKNTTIKCPYLAFEFINGQLLEDNVEQLQLTEKVSIIRVYSFYFEMIENFFISFEIKIS